MKLRDFTLTANGYLRRTCTCLAMGGLVTALRYRTSRRERRLAGCGCGRVLRAYFLVSSARRHRPQSRGFPRQV